MPARKECLVANKGERKKNMAVMLKSRQEIALLREAGRIVAETYEVLRPHIVPGVTTAELDAIAEDYIRSKGAIPVYKGYGARSAQAGQPAIPAFPATICVAINEVICHGIPSAEQHLKEGDIIGIDIGVRYNGWVGDACVTFPVGTIDSESQRLLDAVQDGILVILGLLSRHKRRRKGFPRYENWLVTVWAALCMNMIRKSCTLVVLALA